MRGSQGEILIAGSQQRVGSVGEQAQVYDDTPCHHFPKLARAGGDALRRPFSAVAASLYIFPGLGMLHSPMEAGSGAEKQLAHIAQFTLTVTRQRCEGWQNGRGSWPTSLPSLTHIDTIDCEVFAQNTRGGWRVR